MARKPAAALARQTVEIVARGFYEVGGKRVSIGPEVQRAIDDTEEYPPERGPRPGPGGYATRYEATGETSLEAALRLVNEGAAPCVLNFASAKNPGGGFLNGARAQEESLARSSALYACIEGRAMYDFHRVQHDPLYSSWVIYSPRVPVFRAERGELLEQPYLCGFLTSPACNAGAALEAAGKSGEGRIRAQIERAMRDRVERVLGVAAEQDERSLVLGAWGCGVFRNDAEMIAGLFKEALDGRFSRAFERVVFAVLDFSDEQRFLGPFARRFG